MKRFILMALVLTLCFTGLFAACADTQKYSCSFLGIFDTEITLIGYTQSQEEFQKIADATAAQLKEYNRIFDAYNSYPGLNNLWYVNRYADDAPVEIPKPLYDLIAWCKERWAQGYRQTNIAMGAVLSIWHDYRTAGLENPAQAALPPMEMLEEAAKHINLDDVILDAEKCTVYFADPKLTLDIGAVAKGFAADLIQEYLSAQMPSFLLSLGGNISAGEAPLDGRKHWGVSVENPDAPTNSAVGGNILDVLFVDSCAVVTSGDYWRYYIVDGQPYHHIIDPQTLMPAQHVQGVTVVCESGAWADFLSTALFVMPYEEARAWVEEMEGVEALWSLPDGTVHLSSGMREYARSLGATARD